MTLQLRNNSYWQGQMKQLSMIVLPLLHCNQLLGTVVPTSIH